MLQTLQGKQKYQVTNVGVKKIKLKGFVQKGRISNFGRFSFFAGSS